MQAYYPIDTEWRVLTGNYSLDAMDPKYWDQTMFALYIDGAWEITADVPSLMHKDLDFTDSNGHINVPLYMARIPAPTE